MTQLQKIVAKAKSLRKLYPNAKWTDLIKKASKLVTPAKKSVGAIKKKTAVKKAVVKKAVAKKKIGYKSDRIAQLIKTTPIIRKYKEKGYSRKDAIKNAMLDAGFMSGTKTHKDTKSHNVNIRVMSGVNSKLNELKQMRLKLKEALSNYKKEKDSLIKMYINAHRISPLRYNIKKLETELKSVKRELNKIK
jgi:hypothetical protein